MTTFQTIEPKDYTVEELYVSAPISWELISGSNGIQITDPNYLEDAVTVQRASNSPDDFYQSLTPKVNFESNIYEYVLYRSIKHLYYTNVPYFYSGSVLSTSSLAGLPDESYIISIGQQFYGDRIKPGSFELSTEIANKTIIDDGVGNLYINDSGIETYLGNIFYNQGIAVVKHNTGSAVTYIGDNGLKLVNNSILYVDYESDVKLHRHEVHAKISPSDFNFSLFNPSILGTFTATGSTAAAFTSSMQLQNIQPSGSSTDTFYLRSLMSNNIIKPYITTIGLYNSRYELLAVAKLSEPIQRTFDTDQIFIIRFDTE